MAVVGGDVSVNLTCWGQAFFLDCPCVWLQLSALCPFFQHLKQSPFLTHQACSAGKCFFKQTESTSMASRSLVGYEVE